MLNQPTGPTRDCLFAAWLVFRKEEKLTETDEHVVWSAALDGVVLMYRPADGGSSTYGVGASTPRGELSHFTKDFASEAEALAWFPRDFSPAFRADGCRVIELRREPHERVEEFRGRIATASGGLLEIHGRQ